MPEWRRVLSNGTAGAPWRESTSAAKSPGACTALSLPFSNAEKKEPCRSAGAPGRHRVGGLSLQRTR
jgi:hypothetical protein